MGAFPYSKQCKDCQHVWGGFWFSFNIQTVLEGQHKMSTCPECGSKNVGDYKSKDELEWNE